MTHAVVTTDTESLTATVELTTTAALTATTVLTATAAPTGTTGPTLTPGATPKPDAKLDAALRHQVNGNYDLAIEVYQALLDGEPTPEQHREASFRLAESYVMNGEYLAAAAAFEQFLAGYPDDARVPEATLMLARALDHVNECASAIPYYQQYLSRRVSLADMVYEWIGDCHAAQGRPEEAIAAYQQAVESASDADMEVSLREKIAGVYLAQEDYEAVVTEYDGILDMAKIDTYRAKVEYLAGQALAAAGEVDAAHARYRRALKESLKAEYAYYALIQLVEAGIAVDEFERGMVDYHAGSIYPDAYGAAIDAFNRYLATDSAEKADEALFYKAVSQRNADQASAALETLEMLIKGYPDSEWLPKAWLHKGLTLAAMDADDAAVKAYEDLASFFPADKLASDALWRAAKLRDGEGALAGAADLYQRVQQDFPGFEHADEALWRAGLNHYRLGDPDRALGLWKALLAKYPKSSYRPKALYWLGKLGDEDEAYWDQVVAETPRDYYALRVQQIRAGESVTASRLITAAIEPPIWDAAKAEDEILAWLEDWTEVPAGTSLTKLPVTQTRRLDFGRGEALLAAGMRREALDAFDKVRASAWKKPLTLAQLAFYFHEQGWHGLAARSAMRLVGLWPKGYVHDAPLPLQHLAYSMAYTDLISAEAQPRGLDPLLLAALIRQESLFEPVAESWAGARGLGQVMPATGEGIAKSLGMEDFELDDLYRPWVSVRFGAFYLGVQMKRFDDQVLIALAAYNGGPGNTLRWLELEGDDLDLFVEVITATQSRRYLQKVYEQYHIFEELYRSVGGDQQ